MKLPFVRPGQRVRVKLENGTKVWARVQNVQVDAAPFGEPGNLVPGLISMTMTLDVEL